MSTLKWIAAWSLFAMVVGVGCQPWLGNALAEADEKHVFSTWEGFEADKCASIWLIKRFVDRDAVFRFFPRGEALATGTPFDTPDAALRRYHNRATFEAILAHYGLVDEKLAYLGKIMHDIEINIWQRKVMAETASVLAGVNSIIRSGGSEDEIIAKSLDYFDELFRRAPAGP